MNASRRSSLRLLSGLPALALFATPAGTAAAAETIGEQDVLIVVDMQNCFVPGGTLPVKEGDQIVPLINRIARRFQNVVITQDWHTPGHTSFASSHPGHKPFELIDVPYGKQVLWPDHCVQGTPDAALHHDLDIPHAQLIIRKGFHAQTDSYSAFVEADKKTYTGLGGYLKQRQIRRCFVCGLATDFCVAWTALDGRAAGFQVAVIEDACRAIDLNGSLAAAWDAMGRKGVRRVQSAALLG